MARCDFCGKDIERGTGKIFVKKEGKVLNFCSNRCEKCTFKLGRIPRNTKWTDAHHKLKSKPAKEKAE